MMAGQAKQTVSTIIPALRYRDAPAAIDWLCRAFGFEKHLVVPNDDGTVAHGDTWLSQSVPALLSSPAFTTQRSLLFITWDENDDSPGNQVPTIVIADGVPKGFRSDVAYTHYSLLARFSDSFGVDLHPADLSYRAIYL